MLFTLAKRRQAPVRSRDLSKVAGCPCSKDLLQPRPRPRPALWNAIANSGSGRGPSLPAYRPYSISDALRTVYKLTPSTRFHLPYGSKLFVSASSSPKSTAPSRLESYIVSRGRQWFTEQGARLECTSSFSTRCCSSAWIRFQQRGRQLDV